MRRETSKSTSTTNSGRLSLSCSSNYFGDASNCESVGALRNDVQVEGPCYAECIPVLFSSVCKSSRTDLNADLLLRCARKKLAAGGELAEAVVQWYSIRDHRGRNGFDGNCSGSKACRDSPTRNMVKQHNWQLTVGTRSLT